MIASQILAKAYFLMGWHPQCLALFIAAGVQGAKRLGIEGEGLPGVVEGITFVCYTIGMRYLFTRTTIWITQTTEYALLWIVFLSTAWLLRQGGHITTDIIYMHLQEKTKRTLDGVKY